ncbi:MAG: fused MFS/spermidine synthase [Pirellulales bacterium]
MKQEQGGSATDDSPASSARHMPVLLALFVGSGCAALVYEIVWFQLLQLVIGSSAVSLGVLLGTFMGGMCLGSILLPRVISARWHPLKVYAILELGIAVIGIAVLLGMPLVDRIYTTSVAPGMSSVLLRGAISALCLLPPTLLMGATLPAIARWVETTPRGVSWLGLFYGGNIAGAVFGCLLAGFYLLRVHDMAVATYVAASINAAVALVALALAAMTTYRPRRNIETAGGVIGTSSAWTVYVTIGLSGMTALAAEVIWTRQLSLMLGATVYAFAIILAVFLVGLGIGSSLGAMVAGTTPRPRVALGLCQAGLTAAIAWTAYMLAGSLPFWPIDPELTISPWYNFQLDLVRCAWAVLPPACLWGASFPLALASVAAPGQDAGKLVGGVYAANTVGAIVGAAGASLLLIGWLGTQNAQQVLIAVVGVSSLLMLAPLAWKLRPARQASQVESALSPWGIALAALVIGSATLMTWTVPQPPAELIGYGRFAATVDPPEMIYVGEGMNASIGVSRMKDGARNFHVSGKVVASSEPQDMRLQRMLGHIPALMHPNPRSVLIVGCGAGVTAGTFVLYPEIERIVICEIEPLIPPAAGEHFREENYAVMEDPRVEIVYDDARHYILTTQEKFDIITSDPIHPWVKGAAALYSKEYFELCLKHLNPGGVVTQWVPLYESNLAAVKSEIATFFEAFPYGTIWSNDNHGEGYDIVLLGRAEASTIDVDHLQRRMDCQSCQPIAESLAEVGFRSAIGLLSTYAGRASDLRPWMEGAQINRDRNMRLQYLAGMGLNLYEGGFIYDSMLAHRRFPKNLFVASDAYLELLQEAIDPLPDRR